MTTAPTPVYSGKVVTLYCVDRITERTYPRTVPDDPDKIKAARERAERSGDKVLRVGDPRDAMPGEIPQSTAKSIQQERAEKAAAKLASANQQRGTKREAVKAKRTDKAAKVKPLAAPVPARSIVNTKPTPVNAKPVVCLSKREYYESMGQCVDALGFQGRRLQSRLSEYGPVVRFKKLIFAYATAGEIKAKACLRSPNDVAAPKSLHKGTPTRPIVAIATNQVYATHEDIRKALHISKKWLYNMKPEEVRETPAGNVRLATPQETKQWKQAQGGQMAIAFNQNR